MTPQFHRFAREELLEGGPEWWRRKGSGFGVQSSGEGGPDPVSRIQNPESLIPPIDFAPTYGNTLMGLACSKPFDPNDNYAIIYHAPQPRAMIEVVAPESTGEQHDRDCTSHRIVAYGQTGRVRLTTLTKEFFVPRFLERDEGERTPPCVKYPWDGVANVRPFSGFATPVVEGVY
jgi:hypothetical protein